MHFCERLYPLPLHLIKATSYLSYYIMWHLVLQKVQTLVLTCREWDLKCSLCSCSLPPLAPAWQSEQLYNQVRYFVYGCIWQIIPSRFWRTRIDYNDVTQFPGSITFQIPGGIFQQVVFFLHVYHPILFDRLAIITSHYFTHPCDLWIDFLDGFQASMFIPAPENNICYYYLRSNKEWRD